MDDAVHSADSSPSIEIDLICRECGYNLRGLSPEGSCPECGASCQSAWIGNRLEHSDPVWLQVLARSLSNMRVLLWFPLMTSLLFPAGITTFYINLAFIACYVVQSLRIARPEAGRVEEAEGERLAIRTLCGILIMSSGLTLTGAEWAHWLGALVVPFEAALLWLYLARTSRLAGRLPDYVMQERLQKAKWLLPASWIAFSTAGFGYRHLGGPPVLISFVAMYAITFYTVMSLSWLRTHMNTTIISILTQRYEESLPLTPAKE